MIEATFGSPDAQAGKLLLRFDSPIEILTATQLSEVLPLLKAAEAASKSGHWVALMLCYEAAPVFDSALKTRSPGELPLAWAAVFDHPSQDHTNNDCAPYKAGQWTPRVTREEFGNAIARIRDLIACGDTYQVNYTFPMTAKFSGDSRSWFRNLSQAQGATYCAYFDLGRFKVLSLSPELFFELKGRTILTRPMKGTIKRGRWPEEDKYLAGRLEQSAKDRAENVMIVDLLRNDLGRVSVNGSVNVSHLFEIERYETLWQMTSTIEATLRDDLSLPELMRGLFPCGSITGAPKVRTMEIIRELEPYPRGIYTGTLGFLRPGGDATFNVAIRTVVIDSELGEATFGVGGGITYDSTAESEYEECLVKSSFLNTAPIEFQLLESLLLENGEWFLLERHLERMRATADYFGFRFDETEVSSELYRISSNRSRGRWKVRLLSAKDGSCNAEAVELRTPFEEPLRVGLAAEPVDTNDRFLFHKTTNRAVYEKALASRGDCDDVILWSEKGEVTESTIANVVVVIGDDYFTPPQASGLLAGTFREELLANGKIRERVIYRDELKQAREIYLINSVQGWRKISLVE
jgi:para-aminobenzoate synthetase/4-amino-4-deoxychorismate lyase